MLIRKLQFKISQCFLDKEFEERKGAGGNRESEDRQEHGQNKQEHGQ